MEDIYFIIKGSNLLIIGCIKHLTEFEVLNKMIFDVDLISSISLILSIGHKSRSISVLE